MSEIYSYIYVYKMMNCFFLLSQKNPPPSADTHTLAGSSRATPGSPTPPSSSLRPGGRFTPRLAPTRRALGLSSFLTPSRSTGGRKRPPMESAGVVVGGVWESGGRIGSGGFFFFFFFLVALRDCLGCSLFGDLAANGTRRRHLSVTNRRARFPLGGGGI